MVQKSDFRISATCVGDSKPGNSPNKGKVSNGEGCIGNENTAGSVLGDDPETGVACGVEGKVSVSQSRNPMPGALLTDCNCNRNGKHRNGKKKRNPTVSNPINQFVYTVHRHLVRHPGHHLPRHMSSPLDNRHHNHLSSPAGGHLDNHPFNPAH